MRKRTVARATIVGVTLLIVLTLTVRRSWGTEAPGCGDQHYRPRLAQCCPKYWAGEDLPPKCTHPLLDGFLAQCCAPPQPTPVATVTVEPTCPPGWACESTPTPMVHCAAPTPLPTPESVEKGVCCKEALYIYREAHRAIVQQRIAELRALKGWLRGQMVQCREGYQTVQPVWP